MEIAKRHGLVVIEDGAHSIGATYKGRKIGSIADMTMFSFHPVKPVTTGEGGIIVTNSPVYYEKLKLFRSHGITKEAKLLTQDEGPWYYEMID
jgi:perosamine synthetase